MSDYLIINRDRIDSHFSSYEDWFFNQPEQENLDKTHYSNHEHPYIDFDEWSLDENTEIKPTCGQCTHFERREICNVCKIKPYHYYWGDKSIRLLEERDEFDEICPRYDEAVPF